MKSASNQSLLNSMRKEVVKVKIALRVESIKPYDGLHLFSSKCVYVNRSNNDP